MDPKRKKPQQISSLRFLRGVSRIRNASDKRTTFFEGNGFLSLRNVHRSVSQSFLNSGNVNRPIHAKFLRLKKNQPKIAHSPISVARPERGQALDRQTSTLKYLLILAHHGNNGEISLCKSRNVQKGPPSVPPQGRQGSGGTRKRCRRI